MKWCTSIYLFLTAISYSYSQQLPYEPISKYVKNDVIYWHKNLPYYVAISSDSTEDYDIMHSDKQKKYSNPAYFDTYGYNYIRTKWAVDKTTKKAIQQEITWPVFVDGTPPITKSKLSSKSEYLINGVRYFTKDLMMELIATDVNSGIRNIYYSVNDSTYEKYSEPINLNPTDTFKVKYFSVDNVGNFEAPKKFTYNADDYNIQYAVDSHAPETNLMVNKVVGPTTEISMTSKDKGSGVAITNYTIDDGELQVYTKPFTLDGLSEGFHKISWSSIDRVLNKEKEHRRNVYLDVKSPVIFMSVGSSYYSKDSIMCISDSTHIKLVAYDAHGIKKVAYKFDRDKSYKIYTKPLILPANYQDRQNLRYFATDSLDNDSEIYVLKLQRDSGKPKINFVIDGVSYTRNDTVYVTNKTKFTTFNYDSLSGIEFDKFYVNNESAKSVIFDHEMIYDVVDTLKDNVGNINTQRRIFSCDFTPPKINFVFSEPKIISNNLYHEGTTLFFTITDNTGLESFRITVNGKPIVGTALTMKPGVYKVEAVAVDLLKQISQESISFVVGKSTSLIRKN